MGRASSGPSLTFNGQPPESFFWGLMILQLAKPTAPGWPVSRILSSGRNRVYARRLHPRPTHLGDHLSGTAVACRLVQPTRNSNAAGRGSFLLGLAPDGGCLAAAITGSAVVSYTERLRGNLPAKCYRFAHHFTLTGRSRRYVSVARPAGVPRPGCYPASCPVECGLSSKERKRPFAVTRPA